MKRRAATTKGNLAEREGWLSLEDHIKERMKDPVYREAFEARLEHLRGAFQRRRG